jgi:hypothetical protein
MINLVDMYATLAAVVGERSQPGEAAPDSYDVLPAIVGQPHPTPIRPETILHSARGVYAIRQGPWKWIEGKPSRRLAENQSGNDQFRPQLFHLDSDPGETTDVSRQHPDVVRRLSRWLNKQRERESSRQPVDAT